MTDATTATEAVFVPRGRPVARFVVSIALLSAVLVVVWATGLFNPRLTVGFERWERAAVGDATIVVRNESPAAARVRVVDVSDPFVRLTRPVAEVRVGGGREARVTIFYTVDCAGYARATRTARGATTPELRPVLRVRGPLGPSHRFLLPPSEVVSLEGACPGS
ncbi:MAG: hypothetical protein QOG87_970 [Actinomycetota bacterium]|jgi:hypothetical protein